ncbi:hypothetical protein G127AT_05250 [Agromyces archimandritae]|uniref:ATPase BadF/BadG/BcrA/BcrD type domain-containing protein n=1 Tax=Agromyces archimandritae TaxID=2781962 RepID=A0A975IRJ7_9MICO|nr:hypothetical protein G127AT_05250 [Agromyces archimandritae]
MLAIDIGGTGSRARLVRPGGEPAEFAGPRPAVEAHGTTVPEVVAALIDRALAALAGAPADTESAPAGTESAQTDLAGAPAGRPRIAAVGIGSTGVPSLVADPGALAASLAERAGAPVALAADAVTAHLGALGGAPGIVVAAGTGVVVLGTDLAEQWVRVDGWGHLLGDRGGGARIGMAGLRAAMRAFDGVDAAGLALLAAARAHFGEPEAWPALLYPRADRAGLLAAFTADVARVADAGDACAAAILADAGAELAASAGAAARPGIHPRVALTGGIAAIPQVCAAFDVSLPARLTRVAAAGDPLDGALELARRTAAGSIAARPALVWAAG